MKLYIDLENLKSLANNQDGEIMKLIRENFDVFYVFDEEEIKKEKRQKIVKIENWQKNLSSGRMGKGVGYRTILPSFSEDDKGMLCPKDELQSVFLIKNNHSIPNGLLTSKSISEIDALRNLLIENRCVPAKFYYTRPDKDREIQKWEIVSRNVSPCTDIIINDRYMFAQSDCEYENNSYRLIRELCKKSKGQRLNIVIITKREYNIKKKENGINKVSIPIMTILRNLKRITEDETGFEANITIITQDDDPNKKRIHDRAIFTNYKLFISGDSFMYYRDKIKGDFISTEFISRGLWFGVCSLFDEEHNKIAKRFLIEVQEIINESRDLNIKAIWGEEKERKSNYLILK